jgi:DNA-binding response OmpR family regulator
MRILLVEDDTMIGEAVHDHLRAERFEVEWVRDGHVAEALLRERSFDLVVLDLGLPGRDGMAVLRSLRARAAEPPVIIATARDAVGDRVTGLDAGADDYVLKPYDLDELTARIRAHLRRADRTPRAYERGAVRIDAAAREAVVDGQPVTLSAREWDVLEPLLARPGAILSRAQLEDRLFGRSGEVGNAVEVYVHGLRRKLGADAIRNVRGVGYLLPRP